MKGAFKSVLAAFAGLALGILTQRSTSTPEIQDEFPKGASHSVLQPRGSQSEPRRKSDSDRAIASWVNQAESEELRHWWLQEALQLGESDSVRERLVLERWIALDRHQAIQAISSYPAASGWLSHAVGLWAQLDFDSAIEFFSDFPKWQYQFVLLIEHADQDGEDRLYRKLQEFAPERRQYILSVWANHNIRYRLAWLDDVQDEKQRQRFLADWAREDYAGLLAWSQLPENEEEDVRLLRIEHEGSRHLRSLWDSLDEGERDQALQRVKIPPEDYAAMARWVRSHLTESERQGMVRKLLSTWSEMPGEPSRLAVFYEEWGEFGFSPFPGPLAAMTQAWAEKDPLAMERWASTLPQRFQIYPVQQLFQKWLEADPAAAVSRLEARFPQILGEVIDRESVIGNAQLSYTPFETFTSAVAALPAEHRERQIEMRLRGYGFDVAETDTLLDMAPEGEAKDRAIQLAVAAKAKEEPQQAAEWALGLEDGISKDFAMRNALRAFSNKDPEGAAEWVEARLGYLTEHHRLALSDTVERLAAWLPQRALDLATVSGEDSAFQAALDRMPLTEQNLQEVVARTDLSSEQRSQIDGALARYRFLKEALRAASILPN